MTRHSASDPTEPEPEAGPEPSVHEAWSVPAADLARGREALWWSVGPAGELSVLLVHRRYLEQSPYIKGWVGWRPQGTFTGELVTVTEQGERRTTVEDIGIWPSHLALLPDSRFLLVSSRTRRDSTSGVWRPNAVVYSASGTLEGQFCIGDDIPALVTDRHGRVWTAYGDEGIFGGHPESAAGLAGWDTDGRALWSPRGELPIGPLEGCTAATDGDEVWLVWYAGGRRGTYLTRITPATGETVTYPSPVDDPDGFAFHGNRAVLTRRDHGRRTVTLTRAELDGATWTVTDSRVLDVPGRVVLRCGQGRDGTLWLRTGDTWLRIAV
ncbi:hypothetical protein [Streptomyces griseoaurantiacus]|uniref:Uncharacterized protein n=1 Tax=Streptomyces griseoaurantiacus TaxID=68213 RepID=A0A1G7SV52_9ACTN|nr:hypothetical protein [Streptomyces jietaisiensis]SDG26913.1 hypothetical protein SAMN05216260_116153 [Streptomyces jietaisiensis]